MVQAKLQDFRTILKGWVDGIQLQERFARHAQLGIPAGGSKLPLEFHELALSMTLAKTRKVIVDLVVVVPSPA
jgi:hypothetical protein